MGVRLAVSRTVRLDANGQGIVTLGPERFGDTWTIRRMVTTGDSTARPQCRVYRGGINPGNMLDSTASGNSAVSETNVVLRHGEFLTVLYSYGTENKTMVFSVEGDVITRYAVS